MRKNAVQQKSNFSPELQLMLGTHANDAHAHNWTDINHC